MKIYSSIEEFSADFRVTLTIGTFDGVHIGHQSIIKELNRMSKLEKGESVLLTFDPHPRHVLFPEDHGLKLLTTIDERLDLLKDYGLQHIIIQEFSREFSRITPINFVRDILVNQLSVNRLIIGHDHHFGRNREGSFEELKSLADLYDFKLSEISGKMVNNITASSTKIRQSLLIGDVDKANNLLGHSYTFSGKVVHGDKLGRTIDFPTANIEVRNEKILPKSGVYAVQVELDRNHYFGMLNIGHIINKIEVHIFDFSENIYGRTVRVRMISRLRDGKDFQDIEDLKCQLIKDETDARSLFQI